MAPEYFVVKKDSVTTFSLTALAIVAFAGNSLLTRVALVRPEISASYFVGIRLVSGALMLFLLNLKQQGDIRPRIADTPGIASLFIYAVTFTFAYTTLGAATGALILFPTVQLTLVLIATLRGTSPTRRQQFGLLIAIAGLVILLGPRSSAPTLGGAILMGIAGIAWGVYTFLGRGSSEPFVRTTRNFIGAAPLVIIVMLMGRAEKTTTEGVLLAITSGAVTSALGYVVWYVALPRLKVATAGAAQLLVPVITAVGGLVWLGERPSLAMVVAVALILGGIAITNGLPGFRTTPATGVSTE
jgi:drug/metabolite transporter (DMT)-like permease